MGRYHVLRAIEQLDPEKDHRRIVHLIYAMPDDAVIVSFGFPKPLPFTRPLLRAGLKPRGRAVRWPPPKKDKLTSLTRIDILRTWTIAIRYMRQRPISPELYDRFASAAVPLS